jgi:methyl-accepting chemotaxis protein
MKIARKLALSFVVIVLLLVTLSVLVIKSLGDMDTATNWNIHTYEVLEQANELISGMVNQETGVRGFLVSGDEKFLEPYKGGREQFDRAFDKIKQLTSDNPTQQKRLDQIRSLADDWHSRIAETEIGLMRNAATRDQARGLEASGAGKTAMDGIRSIERDVDGAERGLLVVRAAQRDADSNLTKWTMIVGSMVAAVLAVILGWLLTRGIAKPVSEMTTVMIGLSQGDLAAIVPFAGRKDEVGQMAGALQTFKEALVERARLSEEAARVGQLAEAERAKNEAIKARAAEEQAQAMRRLGEGLKNLASGDLTVSLGEGFPDTYARVRNDFNEAATKLKETILAVVSSTGAIQSGTREISTASDDLSKRTEQQAASLEETAASLDEITTTVNKTAEGAKHAREIVSAAKADAERSGVIVRDAIEAMNGIDKSSKQVSQIIGVIDEIAFQTNLLALNAGVEAARAGDAGRGFAVVASEVRALAQRSAEAAKEIKGLISTSTGQVEQGVELVVQTGKALERIVAQVAEINDVVSAIAASAQEQATGLHQVNTAVNQMDQVTQQNAAMVEESTAASHSLSQETAQLSGLISQFQVGAEAAAAPVRRSVAKPAPAARPALKPAASRGGAAAVRKPEVAEKNWEEF